MSGQALWGLRQGHRGHSEAISALSSERASLPLEWNGSRSWALGKVIREQESWGRGEVFPQLEEILFPQSSKDLGLM